MSLAVFSITVDCTDAIVVGSFWAAALGRSLDTEPMPPSAFFTSIGRSDPAATSVMMFIGVPEAKVTKNRVHLDLQADDRAAEVERLRALGATVVHEKDEWGTRWTTMADPEGNEFCVASH